MYCEFVEPSRAAADLIVSGEKDLGDETNKVLEAIKAKQDQNWFSFSSRWK